MVVYLLGRLTGILVVFTIVSMLAFVLMHSIPGGPFDEEKAPLPPAAKENIHHKYGLARPLYEHYRQNMWSALPGDLAIPFPRPTAPVAQLIARALPAPKQL